jgi:hypothetical protein
MLKRLAVLCVFLGVSIAAAATLKMKFFEYTTGDDQDGVATLHYVPGSDETKIHVTITGFQADTSYIADVGNGLVGGPIVTNHGGNGEVNVVQYGDITGTARTITIYRDYNGDGLVDPNDAVVAYGTAQ